ncbi:hypothetical protein [Lentzea sp. E54]|uniref:hypothetical protein n=1 Tax=Lentzea xerophila TaxID=3435883 RepID=UPI003DA5FFA4
MSQAEKIDAIRRIQDEYNALPRLLRAVSPQHESAQRRGFEEGAAHGYESTRFIARALWAIAELAKMAALGAVAEPTIVGFGSSGQILARDCAPRTAARVIQEMTGVEVPADYLLRAFGIPPATIDGYKAAVAYTRNWFASVGIRLSPRPGGFHPVAEGGVPGRYVIFMMERSGGDGHVVFGEVTAAGVRIVDDQLGRTWTSLTSAQNALGMEATTVSRVEEVVIP